MLWALLRALWARWSPWTRLGSLLTRLRSLWAQWAMWTWVRDGIIMAGLGCMTYGVSLLSVPWAYILFGGVLCFGGIALWRIGKRGTPRPSNRSTADKTEHQ